MGGQHTVGNSAINYEGRQYTVSVQLVNQTNPGQSVILNSEDIYEIDIDTDIRDLYVRAVVFYVDRRGDLSKIGRDDLRCQISLIQADNKSDGDISQFKTGPNAYSHAFVVQNMKQEGRLDAEPNAIKYSIMMSGTEFMLLQKKPKFENFSTAEAEDQPSKIIRALLAASGLKTDDTFDTVGSETHVKYTATEKDTYIDAVNHLLWKMYFTPGSEPEMKVKYLVYDQNKDLYQFRSIDYPQGRSNLDVIQICMHEDQSEKAANSERVDIASKSLASRSDIVVATSKMVVWQYDQDSSGFTMQEIPSRMLINCVNDASVNGRVAEYYDKDAPYRTISEWDNNENMYLWMLKAVTQWDSLVLNVPAVLQRSLLDFAVVVVDGHSWEASEDLAPEKLAVLNDYVQLTGGWFISGIKLIVKPGEGKIRQNLTLSRPFQVKI